MADKYMARADYRSSSAYLRSNRMRVGENRPVWPLTKADLPASYREAAASKGEGW